MSTAASSRTASAGARWRFSDPVGSPADLLTRVHREDVRVLRGVGEQRGEAGWNPGADRIRGERVVQAFQRLAVDVLEPLVSKRSNDVRVEQAPSTGRSMRTVESIVSRIPTPFGRRRSITWEVEPAPRGI
jgi:hypothetical protein